MSQEVKYISKDGSSNKLWSYEITNESKGTVVFRFGRIGSHITEAPKTFGDRYSMQKEINKKVAEKTADVEGKRYKLVDENKVQEETEIAQDIGVQNRILRTLFVRRNELGPNRNKLTELPKYSSDDYVLVEIINSWDKKLTHFLLNKNTSAEIIGLKSDLRFERTTVPDNDFVSGVRRYLKKLVEKVRQVVASCTIASMASRDLDLGNDEDDFKAPEVTEEFVKKVGDKNVSNQVLTAFASLGARELDLF